jgi:hypothetical protein
VPGKRRMQRRHLQVFRQIHRLHRSIKSVNIEFIISIFKLQYRGVKLTFYITLSALPLLGNLLINPKRMTESTSVITTDSGAINSSLQCNKPFLFLPFSSRSSIQSNMLLLMGLPFLFASLFLQLYLPFFFPSLFLQLYLLFFFPTLQCLLP